MGVKISKLHFLFMFWSIAALLGIVFPMACTNTSGEFNPTSPSTPVVASATATNAFGYTSTPTFTLEATGTPTDTPTAAPTMSNPVTLCTPTEPNSIAVNSAGTTLYVAGNDGTLSIYPITGGTAAAAITGFGPNSTVFSSLTGVAVGPGPTPDYYVIDSGSNAVYEFNSSNNPVTTWNNYNGMDFSSPLGIAVDSNENIYVVDTGNDVIDEFTANGAGTVNQWGYSGDGNGQFNYPTGIAVGTGSPVTLYVADMDNGLIQEFSSSGVFINQFSAVPQPDVTTSWGIAVDGIGNVFLADYNNAMVEEYDSAASPVAVSAQWEGPTGAEDTFGPDGVVYSGSQLYVADWNNNAVYTVAP